MASLKKEMHIQRYGPYGRQVPDTFNFVLEQSDRIKSVILSFGAVIDGIGFEIVDESGKSKSSLWYGNQGHETVTIHLTDTERITAISGSYGDYKWDGKLTNVAQLYIHTNVAPTGYGPYGRLHDCTNVKSFRAPDISAPPPGPIVGFFGATGRFVQSIGVTTRTP